MNRKQLLIGFHMIRRDCKAATIFAVFIAVVISHRCGVQLTGEAYTVLIAVIAHSAAGPVPTAVSQQLLFAFIHSPNKVNVGSLVSNAQHRAHIEEIIEEEEEEDLETEND